MDLVRCTQLDCGVCVLCKDKPKFGEPGKLKQCCELKPWRPLTSDDIKISVIPPKPKLMSRPSTSSNNTIDNFLQIKGGNLPAILGDGNCLLPTTLYALLHTEDHHLPIRSHIISHISLNSGVFSQYFMPVK